MKRDRYQYLSQENGDKEQKRKSSWAIETIW